LKCKINELATGSKKKNVKDLYRGINGFKKDYQPRTIVVKMWRVMCWYVHTVFWMSGWVTSVSHWMYVELVMLGRLKYKQASNWLCWGSDGCGKLEKIQMARYWSNSSRRQRLHSEIHKHRFMYLILFRIRKNCLISEGAISFSRRTVLLGGI